LITPYNKAIGLLAGQPWGTDALYPADDSAGPGLLRLVWDEPHLHLTEANETLSFLAIGTCLTPGNSCSPSDPGALPFALLDSVTLTAVPELSTWAMILVGFAAHRRRAKLSLAVQA
jgi:hypothetical protein